MALTFNGGIHPEENKLSAEKPVQRLKAPEKVSIPLSQHIGAPCVCCVQKGDRVKVGQVIGTVENALGVNVHSSVSGTVTDIVRITAPDGRSIENVVIENDFENEEDSSLEPYTGDILDLKADFVIERVRLAGISGMGGATFPTYAKIKSAIGKVNTLIINCCECEPYITSNHRLMLEYPEALISGAKILLKVFNMRKCIIAVEDNKRDAAKKLKEVGGTEMFDVKLMQTKYPQGDERQLIYALTSRQIPTGKLPADVGCVVFNGETVFAIYNAVAFGKPLTHRIVTVSGDCVARPKNVFAPIGASYADLLEFCGGLKKECVKIVNGGPMMGVAQWNSEGVVTKGTSAVLFLSREESGEYSSEGTCIRCGRCTRACPMNLQPVYLSLFSRGGKYDMCRKYDVLSCVECGSCTYVCPASLPLVQLIRAAKVKVKEGAVNNG